MPPPEPAGATMDPVEATSSSDKDPAEAAAFSEMQRLRTQLTNASSYGAGVSAQGKPCRRRPDSKRPSEVLPEAWANMGDAQRVKLEEEVAARRQLLRRQIASLEAEHPMLDFNKLCRTTSSGQVALIMHSPVYDFPWNIDCITSHAQDLWTFGATAQHGMPSSRHAGSSSNSRIQCQAQFF